MISIRLYLLPLLTVALPCAADELASILVEDVAQAPRVGDVIASETTGASSHLDADTLSRPGTSLSSVLSREAGTQVRESGGLGSFAEATLRGSSSNQVMVYLDGLLLNDSSGGGFNLGDIDLLQANQVDVYRGATPVQLSKASMGGAIHIQTRPSDSPSFSLRAGAGSFGTQQLALTGSRNLAQWNTLLSLSHQRSDNDFAFRNDNGTQFNTNDDFDDHRNNAEVEQSTGLLKLGRALSETHHRDISLQWFDKFQRLPNQVNSKFNRASLDTNIWRLQSAERWQNVGHSPWNSKLSLHGSRTRETYRDPDSLIGLREQQDRNSTDVVGLDNYWEHVGEARTFSASASFRYERFRSIDDLQRLPDSKATRNELNLAIQESLYLDDQKWLVTPSLRYQTIADSVEVYSSSSAENALNGDFSHHILSPQIGTSYRVNNTLKLFSNAGQYQRAPSFFELFGDRGLFLGNDELKPEEGTNFDMGFHWTPDNSWQLLGRPQAQMSVFYNDIDDAITRVYDSRGVGKSVNVPGAKAIGLEWDLSGQVGTASRWVIKGTLQDTRNLDTAKAFHDKQLPGQASETVSVQLSHQYGPFNFIYDFQRRSDSYYDTANLRPALDQSVHNLGLEYRQKNLKLEVLLKNINDDIYEDFNGYPKPGRAIFTTLTYSGKNPNE